MFTPCNACPACPARPVECETYSSGVGQMIVLGWNAVAYSTGALLHYALCYFFIVACFS